MKAPPPGNDVRGPAEEDPGGLFDDGGLLPRAPHRCPTCGGPAPEAVSDGSRVNFLCHRCGTCWHIGMGFIWPTDPPRHRGRPRRAPS